MDTEIKFSRDVKRSSTSKDDFGNEKSNRHPRTPPYRDVEHRKASKDDLGNEKSNRDKEKHPKNNTGRTPIYRDVERTKTSKDNFVDKKSNRDNFVDEKSKRDVERTKTSRDKTCIFRYRNRLRTKKYRPEITSLEMIHYTYLDIYRYYFLL